MAGTSTSGVDILSSCSQRRQEIVDLLNLGLGHKRSGERTGEYWTWKHEANPFGPSLVLLAECEGRLVGVRAFMRWRLTWQGGALEVAKPVDTVTHPDYQRRGIFSRLTTAAIEQARQDRIRLLFNTPNQNSLPGYLKLGWRDVGRLALYAKCLRPIAAPWCVLRSRWRPKPAPTLDEFFHENAQPAATILADDAEVAPLLVSPIQTRRVCTDRNLAFLRWRYGQHPNIAYFAEAVRSNGRTEGVLFYRTNVRYGMREIMIDDLVPADADPALVKELVRCLCSRVTAHYLVAHAAEDSPLAAAWRSLGFRRVPRRRIALVAKTLDEPFGPDPFELRNWSLCLGDLEGL